MTAPRSSNFSNVAVISLLLGALGLAACGRIESRLIDRAAQRALQPFRSEWLDDDALHVVLCGTGSPIPSADRASACTAILAGGHFVLVDVGQGSSANLGLWRMPIGRLDSIFLTHFHSDHIAELGEIGMQSWALGRAKQLPVYGPPGVARVVAAFEEAYALDTGYRIAHHGADFIPPAARPLVPNTISSPVSSPEDEVLIFDAGDLRVTAFPVNHDPVSPSYGYRFGYRGRSVVVSGDTVKSPNLVPHAKGADVLVHEALAAHIIGAAAKAAVLRGFERRGRILSDIVSYHTTPVEAAEVAAESEVGLLVLTHLVPPPDNAMAKRLFLSGVDEAWDGEVVLGEDGLHLTLPLGSSKILRERL
jgi:ribonuclease Z